MLDKAILIASQAHLGQRDKGGVSYILHPLRLMMRLRTDDEELMSIAVMHDVIEDHKEWDADRLLAEGFSTRVVAALILLTHGEEVEYFDYIGRMAHNMDALLVKREDLRDNSDITRMKGLRPKDFARLEKYNKAYALVQKLIANFKSVEDFRRDNL